ncbi:MAG: hypothetical protein ABSC91_10775 [Candidatus Bathyarchaeia archaeon]
MQLTYFVPFKAADNVDAQMAIKERLLPIEGTAIDTSVNANKWQVPPEDLDFFVTTLQGTQLRIDHAESAMAVIGKVPEGKKVGDAVKFRAEIGDLPIIEKVLRGYLTHVSVQVDSDDVECSRCKEQTRKEGLLVHLCPGAWEIVHKPRVRELSIVASPAYKNTEFKPLGFASAMNEGQEKARVQFQRKEFLKKLLAVRLVWASLQSSENDKDVGSKGNLQEPENKPESKKEVKPLSAQNNGQQAASPHQAQGVTNVAPGEGAPKQVTYDDLSNQVTKLWDQLKTAGTDAEIDALSKKVAEVEVEVAKRATKKGLTQKLNELSRKMSESAADAADAESAKKGKKGEDGASEGNGDGDGKKPVPQAESAESAGRIATGKGIISNEEVAMEQNGPSAPWFKDLLKANAMQKKLGSATFSG